MSQIIFILRRVDAQATDHIDYGHSLPLTGKDKDGYNVIIYPIKKITQSTYFRPRGTNHPVNTPFEMDEMGSTLADSLVTDNLCRDQTKAAWAGLWFYSNPFFVRIKESGSTKHSKADHFSNNFNN